MQSGMLDETLGALEEASDALISNSMRRE